MLTPDEVNNIKTYILSPDIISFNVGVTILQHYVPRYNKAEHILTIIYDIIVVEFNKNNNLILDDSIRVITQTVGIFKLSLGYSNNGNSLCFQAPNCSFSLNFEKDLKLKFNYLVINLIKALIAV
jgi:hypothetical protein